MDQQTLNIILGVLGSFSGGGEDDELRRRTADIQQSIRNIEANLANTIVTEADATEAQAVELFEKLKDFLHAQAAFENSNIDQLERNVLDEIEGVIGDVATINDSVHSTISSAISEGSKDLSDDVTNIFNAALDPILDSIGTTDSVLSDIDRKFDLNFQDVRSGIDSVVEILQGGIKTVIENNIIIDSSIFDYVLSTVGSIVEAQHAGTALIIEELSGSIRDVIGREMQVGNILEEEGNTYLERLAIATEEKVVNDNVVDSARLDDTAGGLGGITMNSILDWIDENILIDNGDLETAANEAMFEGMSPTQIIEMCSVKLASQNVGSGIAFRIISFISTLLSAVQLPMALAGVQTNRTLQDFRECFPDALLSPGDTAASFQRGLLSGSDAIRTLRKQGFKGSDAVTLINSSYQVPNLEYLYVMWFRDKISDEVLESQIEALGFNPAFVDVFKDIAYFIPPVQDLVTMAVREVFSENIARANGQFDDFPPEFAKFAGQQGVSQEWAERYWAAHWRLPSENMGFEMFHRQIIDEEKLRGLMTALDIMPGWRDEMLAISYNPLTRVDVRRMHAMGVLTDAQTLKAYRDIGYSPENADLMLRFTKEYNDEGSILEVEVASDLTRSNIIGFYTDGIIDKEVALALLIQAGINVVAAGLFIASAELDMERKERRDSINIALEKFAFRQIGFAQAVDELNTLPLEKKERELVLLDLDKEARKQNKIPSPSDLNKFLAAGIVDEEEYVTTMQLNGYSRLWAERYLALETGDF